MAEIFGIDGVIILLVPLLVIVGVVLLVTRLTKRR